MISKFTFFKLFALAVFLFSMSAVNAQTYPVYLTETGTVTLGLQTALKPGETAVWAENGTTLTSAANGSYTIPVGSSVGEHIYKVHLISPASCVGDVTEYKVYVLPATTIALSDASTALYCENAATPTSSFTATGTPAAALPSGVTYTYTWTGTKDGSSVADITAWGNPTTSPDTRSCEFVFNTTTVGKYTLTARLNYVVPAGAVLKTGDGLGDVKISNAKPVEVSAKPSTPSIIVVM